MDFVQTPTADLNNIQSGVRIDVGIPMHGCGAAGRMQVPDSALKRRAAAAGDAIDPVAIERGDQLFEITYLLLVSASLDLLEQSGESLAGRIAYLELAPFNVRETQTLPAGDLWVRGGFPDSLLAPDELHSLRWRQDFIRTYLERDIPQFGPRIAAETLRRLWGMLAHHQGGLLNTAQFARNLGVDAKTAASYLDLLIVRRLPAWHANIGKRLVKSPKVYVRDSGLVHALLNIPDKETLMAHPVVGQSWEGFIIENLLICAADKAQGHFYRTSGGAEIDLLLAWPDGGLWAVEIKRSLSPRIERGFHADCEDLAPDRKFVVYSGQERYRIAADIEAISLAGLAAEISTA